MSDANKFDESQVDLLLELHICKLCFFQWSHPNAILAFLKADTAPGRVLRWKQVLGSFLSFVFLLISLTWKQIP